MLFSIRKSSATNTVKIVLVGQNRAFTEKGRNRFWVIEVSTREQGENVVLEEIANFNLLLLVVAAIIVVLLGGLLEVFTGRRLDRILAPSGVSRNGWTMGNDDILLTPPTRRRRRGVLVGEKVGLRHDE